MEFKGIPEKAVNGGMAAVAGAVSVLYAPNSFTILFVAAAIGSISTTIAFIVLGHKWRYWFLGTLSIFVLVSVYFIYFSDPFNENDVLEVLPREGVSIRESAWFGSRRLVAIPESSLVTYTGKKSPRRIRAERQNGNTYFSFWHLVTYKDLQGWVYGAYLEIQEEDHGNR